MAHMKQYAIKRDPLSCSRNPGVMTLRHLAASIITSGVELIATAPIKRIRGEIVDPKEVKETIKWFADGDSGNLTLSLCCEVIELEIVWIQRKVAEYVRERERGKRKIKKMFNSDRLDWPCSRRFQNAGTGAFYSLPKSRLFSEALKLYRSPASSNSGEADAEGWC